jgi:hypothetical protein
MWMGKLTQDEFWHIVGECEFGAWNFHIGYDDTRPFLQVKATTSHNTKPGESLSWHGRKWFLSPHMTKSEVVQTAFKAVITAVEHEVREQFKYRGVPIFGPHFDVDSLVTLYETGHGEDSR